VERGHLPDAGGRSDRRPSRPTRPTWSVPAGAAIETGKTDLGFFRLGAEAYGQARAISFDYAIMERAERVMTVPLTGRLVGSRLLGCAVAGGRVPTTAAMR
jgi:hypothetical protein